MIIEKKLLEIDYCLAKWLAYHKSRVIPGTVYFFLFKLSFWTVCLYFVLLSVLPFNIGLEAAVLLTVVIIGVIMYGLQKRYEKKVKELQLTRKYEQLSPGTIKFYRALGLFLFILAFASIFIVGANTIEGYGVE